MRLCKCCELEISQARLNAIPDAEYCTICQKIQGDVPMIRGYMSWEHKTAPTIIIGDDADKLRSYDRHGFHAQLPLNSKNNPRMISSLSSQNLSSAIKVELPKEDTNLESVNVSSSRCHPNRPRVNPKGDCAECALLWYQKTQHQKQSRKQ